MSKTNFDLFLEEQLCDPDFARRFEQAGEAWDVALQLAALREQAGLSQRELARKLKTTQQQISRLESPGYEGHSLSMLRRVARVLHAEMRGGFGAMSSPPRIVSKHPAPGMEPSASEDLVNFRSILPRMPHVTSLSRPRKH